MQIPLFPSTGFKQCQVESPSCRGSSIRLGELFSGAGGMALGASWASYKRWGFEHVWAIDFDRDSCQTIKENEVVRCDRVKRQDVRIVDFAAMPNIDGLVFGFPCNDFSVVGERRGIRGQYGGLYKNGVEALNALNPKFFVAENVSGLSSVNKRADFERILDELREAGLGYKVVENLYKFEEYGIPQKRHRYIIVGFRCDTDITFQHPKPNGKIKTAREALEGNPIPDHVPNNERTVQSQRVVERLKYINPGENVFTAKRIPDRLKLKMKSGATISQIYRRLLPDEPSYTVTGSGGGGTHLYHWEDDRALTNRERARLQTFPDTYVFEGGKESVRRQIGMAVPPEGAKIVFQALLTRIVEEMEKGSWK